MTLADIFLGELDKSGLPASGPIQTLGRELVKRYNSNLETLSSIAADYVKTYHELADLKAELVDKAELGDQLAENGQRFVDAMAGEP